MKNNKLSLAISTILGVFILASPAYADLVIKTSTTPVPVVTTPVAVVTKTSTTSVPDATDPVAVVTKTTTTTLSTAVDEPKVSGFGNSIPLDQALQQMLPNESWAIKWSGSDSDVSRLKSEKVSWHADNVPLKDEVNKVTLLAHNTNGSVDYKLKTITISSIVASPPTTVVTTKVITTTPVFKSVYTPSSENVNVMPVAVEPIVETWQLDPSLTLKENVLKWAKKANYNVVWQASDYKIFGTTVFTGAFDSEDGPIMKVISAYEHSDQPLKASITVKDRVLFVHNKNWDMPTVIPVNSNDDVAPDIQGHDAPAHIPDVSKQAAKTYDPYKASGTSGGTSVSGN